MSKPCDLSLTAYDVRSALEYDPISGIFTWRTRADRSAYWNRRFAGRQAGVFNSEGYIGITLNDRLYLAHRLAWIFVYSEWPAGRIDHIDGVPSNNAIANLRVANQTQNNANMRRTARNTSGFKGVSRLASGSWGAWIKVHGKSKNLGTFSTPESAHAAYVSEAKKAFGDFARAE